MKTIKHFFRWVIKVCQYAVVLWDDYDWDYHYILKLLQYKLKRTRKCIQNNQIIMDADKVASEIHIAELLIDRILADEYLTRDYTEFERKWGPCVFDPYMRHENEKTEADKERCRKDFKIISDLATEKEVADWQYLWNHLRRHMKGWWD